MIVDAIAREIYRQRVDAERNGAEIAEQAVYIDHRTYAELRSEIKGPVSDLMG